MSTAAVSSSSLNQQIHEYFHTRQSDLQELGQALEAGDVTAAQTAFQAITTLGQSGPFANGDPFAINQREQDFTAIGTALQSGDLAGAQQSFSALEATFEKSKGGPVPIADPILTAAPSSTSTVGPEIVLNLSSASLGATPEQITININPTSGGGEQVSLSVGQPGSNTPPVTLNLPANSNEEIVLNLLGTSSTTGGTTTGTASNSSSTGSSPANGGLNVSA